jgi:putative aldouronate transport system permease protein
MNTKSSLMRARKGSTLVYVRNNWDLYIMLIPALTYIIVYKFFPLLGLSIAFKNFSMFAGDGILDSIIKSDWVGLKHFRKIFGSDEFFRVLSNTLIISGYKLIFLFPYPIILALLLNEFRFMAFKKTIQTSIYLPHFLSWVVVYGIFFQLLGNDGLLNNAIASLGGEKVSFFMNQKIFRGLLVFTEGWKDGGWDTIVYAAAITGIDPALYEAATLDGAKRLQKMRYITLPSILPVVSLMLIMRLGKILHSGYEQVLVMYNPTVYDVADILQTYVYRMGLGRMNFSLATAVGLFESVVAFILVTSSNAASKKLLGKSIW